MRRYPSNMPWLLASFAIVAITSASCRPHANSTTTTIPDEADAGKAVPTMWFADSTDPSPANVPPHVLQKMATARSFLDADKLLPPEWRLCGRLVDENDVWQIECQPMGPYLNSSIVVVMRGNEVLRRYYSDAFDARSWWTETDWFIRLRDLEERLDDFPQR